MSSGDPKFCTGCCDSRCTDHGRAAFVSPPPPPMAPDDPIVVEAVRLSMLKTFSRVKARANYGARAALPGRIRAVLKGLRDAGFHVYIDGRSK